MVTPLDELQRAAKLIEIEGIDGYATVLRSFGEEVANTLLVAHLRRGFGSMNQYPPDPEIDKKVEEFLKKRKINFSVD